jgi:endonuclease/exonuclease/phosphatase family metal-dependent hydrolase
MMGMNDAVRVAWRAAPGATRYRVKWAFAPWDKWPASTRYSSWLPATTRAAILPLATNPATDRTMTATPYGNPVWSRVQSANGTRLGPWSAWKVSWPGVATPQSGDRVRMGTYNVMLAGQSNWAARMGRIAQNIAANGLTMVALQETLNTNGSDVASRLTSLTHHTWKVASTGRSEGRILYDSSRYSISGSGLLNDYSPSGQAIHSYRTGATIPTPWARFKAIGSYRSFVVVSIHFAPSSVSGPNRTANRQTGDSARAVVAALGQLLRSGEPAVVAGDFASGYQVWGDQNPAQPTLVRYGWYDAMAAQYKANVAFSTVNGRRTQRRAVTTGGRADGIFLRGIRGTTLYKNVANYFMPGTRVPPSDHNLVYTDFQVPR